MSRRWCAVALNRFVLACGNTSLLFACVTNSFGAGMKANHFRSPLRYVGVGLSSANANSV